MSDITTYEEAKKCPKCGRVGEVRGKRQAPNLPRGTMIHTVYCVTELCKWFDTPFYVQVNPDGSVPPPRNHTGEKKHYIGFEGHDDLAKRIVDNVRAQHEKEKDEHYEIKNPNSR
jgi:hypothetical protein